MNDDDTVEAANARVAEAAQAEQDAAPNSVAIVFGGDVEVTPSGDLDVRSGDAPADAPAPDGPALFAGDGTYPDRPVIGGPYGAPTWAETAPTAGEVTDTTEDSPGV